jgi:hypothetical protein
MMVWSWDRNWVVSAGMSVGLIELLTGASFRGPKWGRMNLDVVAVVVLISWVVDGQGVS